MKRKPLLITSGCEEKHFEVLDRRLQLPFDTIGGVWRDYTLQDAFRLRVFLDLIRREKLERPDQEGSGDLIEGNAPNIQLAGYVVGKALKDIQPWSLHENGSPVFVGAAEYFEQPADGEGYFRLQAFCGSVERFSRWNDDQKASGAEEKLTIILRKVLLVNATEAGQRVVAIARDLGLPEAEPPVGWPDHGRATE